MVSSVQPTTMVRAGGDGVECSRRRDSLPVRVEAPAGDGVFAAQPATVTSAGGDAIATAAGCLGITLWRTGVYGHIGSTFVAVQKRDQMCPRQSRIRRKRCRRSPSSFATRHRSAGQETIPVDFGDVIVNRPLNRLGEIPALGNVAIPCHRSDGRRCQYRSRGQTRCRNNCQPNLHHKSFASSTEPGRITRILKRQTSIHGMRGFLALGRWHTVGHPALTRTGT